MSGNGVRERSQRRRADARREERPFLIALLVVLAVVVAMALGPVRALSAASGRVDELTHQRDVLSGEVDRLEQRRTDLHDPDGLAVEARRELGLVMPGERAYIVVPDADGALPGDEQIVDPQAAVDDVEPRPWYRRVLDALGGG